MEPESSLPYSQAPATCSYPIIIIIIIIIIIAKYYVDKMKKEEMGEVCRAHGIKEKCRDVSQQFARQTDVSSIS